jgi:CRP/FNR family cyclic AMP-dependent transcriptional regulator
MIEGMEKLVREHRFFAGLDDETLTLIAGCARNVVFKAGEYLFHTGDPADEFYLIRHGRVVLDVVAPGRAPVSFQTAGENEIVGVSWLLPPYKWMHDARAAELVRAVGMDARCLRDKCMADHNVGYDLLMRFVPLLISRLQATRMQLLDVYGAPSS